MTLIKISLGQYIFFQNIRCPRHALEFENNVLSLASLIKILPAYHDGGILDGDNSTIYSYLMTNLL